MTLVEQLRGLDLAMGSWYAPLDREVLDEAGQPTGETVTERRFVGWTTDEAKATAASEAGATLRPYRSTNPKFSGWEVTIREAVE